MEADDYSIKIRIPSLVDVFYLPVLFFRAIQEDYQFYDSSVRNRIKKKNSLRRLLVAKLRKRRLVLVAYSHGRRVGILLGSSNPSGVGMVNWLYTLPEFRKKKIGRRLLEKAENDFLNRGCHKITLTTEVAPEFYRRIGYTEEGILRKHWWGKDFYIFSKALKDLK